MSSAAVVIDTLRVSSRSVSSSKKANRKSQKLSIFMKMAERPGDVRLHSNK